MSRAVSIPPLGTEFNDFLFASLGEDKNGMQLSVVSALARLDVDPWQVAAELAGLPRRGATQRLLSLIELLPPELPLHQHADTTAVSLLARLPFRTDFNRGNKEERVGALKFTNSVIGLYLICTMALMLLEWSVAVQPPPAQSAGAQTSTPAPSTIDPSWTEGVVTQPAVREVGNGYMPLSGYPRRLAWHRNAKRK